MRRELSEIFPYLAASPLFGLTATLVAYQLAAWLQRRAGGTPLLNPVLLSVVLLGGLLLATDTGYRTYFDGAQFINFLLGPAVVALAVPLHRHLPTIRRHALPIFGSVLAGGAVAVAVAAGVAALLGAPGEVIASLAPRSTTTPVAIGVAEEIGGVPALAAVFAITSGIVGAVVGPVLLNAIGVRDEEDQGLALGVASHGIGTGRALELHEATGAFAGLGFALNAVLTAALLPPLVQLF